MRPRKYYAVYNWGKVVHICEGLTEAKMHVEVLRHHGGNAGLSRGFKTLEAAEGYQHAHNNRPQPTPADEREARRKAELRQLLAEREKLDRRIAALSP